MQNKQQTFDLHCHTTASDGRLDAGQLWQLAESLSLELLAVSDHDTLDAYLQLAPQVVGSPTRLMPAVEFSCQWRGTNIHLLAYGEALQSEHGRNKVESQQQKRFARARTIAERLEKKAGIAAGLYERVCERAQGSMPGRPHFAQVLVEERICSSHEMAFSRWLGAGKPGDVKTYWPTLGELCRELSALGCDLSLAHPGHYKMTATRLRNCLDEFVAEGGVALEIASPGIQSGQYGWLVDQARKRGLWQSAGSDFHGAATPWRKLGCFPAPAEDVPLIQERWF